ncbi:MAG: hypothetical protein JJ909_04725 [Roseivirga sp.]|uniref:methionyl-tRNA formyltransferase n=1 Tax=Roseivirga sp. TaxID=1964215 RepID=UPI001AFF1BBC|nr:formyltransferase family protein [Roseivirga sp.]MBO6660988.1 hypothetical protein [Roseivirga sp.]MBO6760265.1 hypothetical protein [Roseivirga sp.]MBO6909028.1 hypothetical protein [Roseivirga sp.]
MIKRIAVFGCKNTTQFLLRNLVIHTKIDQIITIDEEKGRTMQVADYINIQLFGEENNIPVYVAKKYSLKSQEDIEAIIGMNIDIAFVIGWQRIIPAEILSSFGIGAFGMHGSSMNLPLGRGRSPMNWAIIEGREVFYTNLFKYDPGVDSGDILDTVKFQVTANDTGGTMHFKNVLSMKYLIEKNLPLLRDEAFTLTKQRADIEPTYYPKRTPKNGLIDWSQDVINVERLIRAVTRPFDGAYSFINSNRINIFASQILDQFEFGYEKSLEGTVLEVFNDANFLVKCFGGLLLITEWEGEYQPKVGDRFDNGDETVQYFKTNDLGFYDLPE